MKDFLIKHAIIPARDLSEPQRNIMRQYVPDRLIENGDGGAHILSGQDDLLIVVAGGAGRHSSIIPSFGNTRAVTEVIFPT